MSTCKQILLQLFSGMLWLTSWTAAAAQDPTVLQSVSPFGSIHREILPGTGLSTTSLRTWSPYGTVACYPRVKFRIYNNGNPLDAQAYALKDGRNDWKVEFTNTYGEPVFFDYEVRADTSAGSEVLRSGRLALAGEGKKAVRMIWVKSINAAHLFVVIKRVRFNQDDAEHPYADCVR